MRRLHLDKHTIRLTLSYLAIIMLTSCIFSVVLYARTKTTTTFHQIGAVSNGTVHIITGGGKTVTLSNDELNTLIQSHYFVTKSNLARELAYGNILLLLVASVASYLLARRNLSPIEQAVALQSRFASDAAHELKTPLAIVRAEHEAALRSEALPKPSRRLSESTLEEMRRLEGLTEALLQLAQSNKAATSGAVWADDAATEAINQVIKIAQAKQIIIEDSWPHIRVAVGVQDLVRVTVILLDNAIKYSSPKSVVRLTGDRKGKYVYLRVTDTGIGISEEHLPHVFDQFYQVERSGTADSARGHGLGLSIAKRLVEQQRGDIHVTSALGKGSMFTIKLPLSR